MDWIAWLDAALSTSSSVSKTAPRATRTHASTCPVRARAEACVKYNNAKRNARRLPSGVPPPAAAHLRSARPAAHLRRRHRPRWVSARPGGRHQMGCPMRCLVRAGRRTRCPTCKVSDKLSHQPQVKQVVVPFGLMRPAAHFFRVVRAFVSRFLQLLPFRSHSRWVEFAKAFSAIYDTKAHRRRVVVPLQLVSCAIVHCFIYNHSTSP